ncbi:MAG: UDP-N-acetylmuramoyl-L-alanyl-D-glutamate--2,6-diaminopimelate ligase [Candidatus Daviesbacteria bacterium]|nr:UDP-N-acetylmuramoyl-L-alanyl-D-glutamate--2,6-diaminopimelate ligase [Candidatus Daviesbacteria bacterium]
MLKTLKKHIPLSVINYGKHLPEAVLANVQNGFPGKKLKVIGVTGTDGKTTTVNMIYRILQAAGKKVSMISTINAEIGGKSYDTGLHVTSPKTSDLQAFMKKSVENGDELMVLEVSSHAISQFRVWGVNFEIGVITNITPDHLDYHGSFENYVKAKGSLLSNVKYAVLNKDDKQFDLLKKMTTGKVLTFSKNNDADINYRNLQLKLKVPGEYNQLNAEAAFLVGQALGIEKKVIVDALNNFTGLTGRMESIDNNLGISVFVDFATTSNAYENILEDLKAKTKGKLIILFGSAAERDSSKRSKIGEIAARFADITILTDDDPRFEDRNKIMEEIAVGYYKVRGKDDSHLYKQLGRKEAIELAFKLAKKGDVIALIGKGHEKSMAIEGKELPWSDQEAALSIIKKLQSKS